MGKYFCDNLELKKEALKMAYICKVTKKICPHVKYSVDGEASPDVLFTLKGCGLNKKEEPINVVEVKEEIVEKKEEETKIVKSIEDTNIDIIEKKENEVKSESKTNTPKQNSYNKKKKKYQPKNQEQK